MGVICCKLCGSKTGDPHQTWCPLYDEVFGR